MRDLLDYRHTRTKADRWCEITVKLEIEDARTDAQESAIADAAEMWRAGDLRRLQSSLLMAGLGLRISVCGSEGTTMRRGAAKKAALDYWTTFFEDSPEEIIAMGKRFGKRFSTARGAARFVLATDGAMHGLDVHGPEDGSTVRVLESCGQIRDTLADYFPEHSALMSAHLSDMNAGAPDQMRALADMPPVVYPVSYYDAACAWLKSRDLLESKCEGWIYVTGDGFIPAEGYRYGSRWVHSVIPLATLEALRALDGRALVREARAA